MSTAEAVPLVQERVRNGESVLDALEAVAASEGITAGALRSAYYRAREGAGTHHGNCILTATEDQALVYAAQAFSYTNFPLSRARLASLVDQLWGKRVGITWARDWTKRHRTELSTRTCKALSDKRTSSSVYEEVVEWADQLGNFIQERKLPPWAVINYDECRLVGGGERLAVKRIQAADRERNNAVSTRGSTVASILTFVAGDGAPFLSVYVFRGRFREASTTTARFTLSRCQTRTRGSWPRLYGWTDTGFVDAATFAAVMDYFCQEWKVRNPDQDCLLIGDQLGAHRQVEVVRMAARHNVLCWWLVANTSHFLQVLDDKCFARLKKVVPVLSEEKVLDAMVNNESARDCLLEAAYDAERISFNRRTIQASFKSVGLYPWDRERVLELARLNLGIGLPTDGVADQARAAAVAVITEARMQRAAGKRTVVSGQAVVEKAKVYSGQDLLKQHEARMAAEAAEASRKAAAAAEKEATKAANASKKAAEVAHRALLVCQVCKERTHRGGAAWHVCRCASFRVCPVCLKDENGKVVVSAHAVVCSSSL